MSTIPNFSQPIILSEVSTPSEPDSGYLKVYGKSGALCSIANGGSEQSYLTTAGANGILTVGSEIITQAVATSGSPTALTVTGGAHTTLTTAEVTDGYFNAARTVNFGATGGTVASQRTWRFTAPTFTAGAATTITDLATVTISGAPTASTNVTATNSFALNIESGAIRTNSSASSYGGSVGILVFESRLASPNSGLAGISIYANGGITSKGDITLLNNGVFTGKTLTFDSGWGNISKSSSSLNGSGNHFTSAYNIGLVPTATYGVQVINGTSAMKLQVYNTFTSSTAYEVGVFDWQTTSNTLRIGTDKGSAGGSARDVAITHGGTVVANFLADRFYLGPIADSTATGGNARGQYAVDLQMYRTAATQVASGANSICIGIRNTASYNNSTAIGGLNSATGNEALAIGYSNTANGQRAVAVGAYNSSSTFDSWAFGVSNAVSGNYSVAIGQSNTVSSSYSFGYGYAARCDRYGMTAFANGLFAAVGDAQQCGFIARRKTTDATPTNLGLDGSTTRLTVPSGKTMSGFLIVKGIKSDGSAKARFVRFCDITNVGGTTTLDTPVESIVTDYNPSACVLAVTAEDATDDLQINITAPVGETWRWVATFNGLEIVYGT